MRNQFVEVSNVLRFLDAVEKLNIRGAREKQIVVLCGDAGLGKSRTGVWWGTRENAVHVYVKPGASASWILSDLVRELSLVPKHRSRELFAQAVGNLVREPRPIVVDEVEHALKNDIEALDTLRAIADTAEVPLILIGREQTAEKLRRHRQIWTRVCAVAEFQKLTRADIRLLADRLVEGEVADDVVDEILRACDGGTRDAMAAIAHVDVQAKKNKGRPVTMEDVGTVQVVHGGARRASNVIAINRGSS